MQRFISGDSHIDLTWLPPDTFTARAPNQWKNAAPRVVETERGLRWRTEDLDLGGVAGVGPSGSDLAMFQDSDERIHRMVQVGFYDDAAKGLFHPTTVELRLRDQDVDGVEAEVIYGVLGVADKIEDRELAGVVHQIYNDWISDFCKGNESRFAGLACLPNHDSVAAAKELRRAAKLGLRGAEISVSTAAKPIYHRDWDVLWEAAADLGMPISFHCRGLPARPPDPVDAERYSLEFKAVSSAVFELSAPEALASIILSGACGPVSGVSLCPWGKRGQLDTVRAWLYGPALRRPLQGPRPGYEAERLLEPSRIHDVPKGTLRRGPCAPRWGREHHVGLRLPSSGRSLAGLPADCRGEPLGPGRFGAAEDRLREHRHALRIALTLEEPGDQVRRHHRGRRLRRLRAGCSVVRTARPYGAAHRSRSRLP